MIKYLLIIVLTLSGCSKVAEKENQTKKIVPEIVKIDLKPTLETKPIEVDKNKIQQS